MDRFHGDIGRDSFSCDLATEETNNNLSVPSGPPISRKLRSNSYRRAISTPPKVVVSQSLTSVPERDEVSVFQLSFTPPDLLHYQQITENGIGNDSLDDEGDEVTQSPMGSGELERVGSLKQSWMSQLHVQNSGILQHMSQRDVKRQEAMFELITSERSYLRSLTVLVNYFMKSSQLQSCMSKTEFHHLFSNVEAVKTASKRFFSALERRRKASSIFIDDVCDIVCDFVTSGAFEPYVTYCSNETYQQKALQKLMVENLDFSRVLRTLESGKECSNLPLHSFLLLPMQRITRMPLLIDLQSAAEKHFVDWIVLMASVEANVMTIRQRCDVTMLQYRVASRALAETTKLVKICNERAKALERTEEMIQLQHQLEFKSSRSFALVSSSRYLLKRGPIVRVVEEIVLGFRRVARQEIYLFLFNDVLLIAKKKGPESYAVTDYCHKNRLRARDITGDDECTFLLTLESNSQDKQETELRLEVEKPNQKARWMMAIKSATTYKAKISSETMQVQIVRSLLTVEPDMTSLKVMDVYIVLSATPDGWIYGERISDGCRAWFPSTHVKEILNERTRERNLQRRSRLMGEQTIV